MSIKRVKSKVHEPARYTADYSQKMYKKTADWFLKKLERDSKDILKHKVKPKVENDSEESDNGL